MRLGSLVLMCLIGATPALADEAARTGAAAFGDWRTDSPGARRLIRPAELPAPYATSSTANMSQREARTAAETPKAPPGFVVDLFASGLNMPRVIRIAPNGDIFVAETGAGRVRVFHPTKAGGAPAQGEVFAEGLQRPYGIAFYPSGQNPQFVYVATPDSVVRFPYRSGETKASGPAERIATLPSGGGHWTRDLAFSPDGKTLFVSVGSGSNVDEGAPRADQTQIAEAPLGASFGDEQRRADVLAFDPDGKHERVYATGIRNCSGLAVQPGTGALWCAVNERDGLGDNLPPDYATHVAEGAFYGWPWYYLGDHQDPRHKGERPDLANSVTNARRSHPGAFSAARHSLLWGRSIPPRIQGRRVRHAARLMESFQAHGLQGRAPPNEGRQRDGRVRGFSCRLRRRRQERLGPPGRRRGDP